MRPKNSEPFGTACPTKKTEELERRVSHCPALRVRDSGTLDRVFQLARDRIMKKSEASATRSTQQIVGRGAAPPPCVCDKPSCGTHPSSIAYRTSSAG